MSEAKRRKYTEEFKTDAVRLVREANWPVAQAARELGAGRQDRISGQATVSEGYVHLEAVWCVYR